MMPLHLDSRALSAASVSDCMIGFGVGVKEELKHVLFVALICPASISYRMLYQFIKEYELKNTSIHFFSESQNWYLFSTEATVQKKMVTIAKQQHILNTKQKKAICLEIEKQEHATYIASYWKKKLLGR